MCEQEYRRSQHPYAGVISFIIPFVTGVIEYFFLFKLDLLRTMFEGPEWYDFPTALFLLLLIIGGISASVVGTVLGIVGRTEENWKRVFPVVGLGLNPLIIIALALLLPTMLLY